MASGPQVIVEFVADVTKIAGGVKKGLESANKAAAGGKSVDWKSLQKWGAVAAGLGTATKIIVDAVGSTNDLAKATIALQRATGMEAETASGWVQLLAQRNIDTQKFTTSVAVLSRKMMDWAKGGEATNSVLKDLGVSFEDVAAGNVDAVLRQVADAFVAMDNPAQAADAAVRLFGKSGVALLPVLAMGSAGIDAQIEMFRKYGATLDSDAIDAQKDVTKASRDLAAAQEGVSNTIGSALLPVQADLYQALDRIVQVMQPLLTNTDAMTVAVVALGGAYIASKAVIAATTAIQAFQTAGVIAGKAASSAFTAVQWLQVAAQWALNAAMAAGLWPILAIAAAIAAVIAIGYVLIKNWDAIAAAATRVWNWVKAKVKACYDWIAQNWPKLLAILTGPIGIAVAIIVKHWDTIKAAAKRCTDAIRSAWNSLTSWLSGIFNKIGAWLTQLGQKMLAPVDGAKAAYEGVKRWIGKIADYISSMVGKIGNAANRIAEAIKRPINSVINRWNGLAFTIPSVKIPSAKIGDKKIGGGTIGGSRIDFPNIPPLAKGGVLESPTLFLGGEAGREIVTPEALLISLLKEHAGGSYQLNLNTLQADSADVQIGFRRLELLRGR